MATFGRVLALGFFDGVHLGHKALLDLVVSRAQEHDLIPSILSFDNHPDNVLSETKTELLYSGEKRREIVAGEFGISDTIFLHFDHETMMTEWECFLDKLVTDYHVRWFVAGYDFRFGYRGTGNTERIREYCRKNRIGYDIVPAVIKDGVTVRSNLIRELIKQGNLIQANKLLGRIYSLEGRIQKGFHVGTKIGFPTINLSIPDGLIIPRFGVYASRTLLNGVSYTSITNIGIRPTFSDSKAVTVETFILGFHDIVYDNETEIFLYDFIRDEVRFDNADELAVQIRNDIKSVSAFFENQ